MKLGIDYSINSPAVTALDNDQYHFFSFFHSDFDDLDSLFKKSKTAHTFLIKELNELKDISLVPFPRIAPKKSIYSEKEVAKLEDSIVLAHKIANKPLEKSSTQKIESAAYEGYSYGSAGNSLIDLVFGVSLSRLTMYNLTGGNIKIFSPSEIKKLAGKGNADKLFMYDAFINNSLNDDNLKKSEFWQWVKDNEAKVIKLKKNDKKEINKPLDDIIDSYFILKKLLSV